MEHGFVYQLITKLVFIFQFFIEMVRPRNKERKIENSSEDFRS